MRTKISLNKITLVAYFAVLPWFTSCVDKSMQVRHYVDPGVNFLGFETFNWLEADKLGREDNAFMSEEMDAFVHKYAEGVLFSKGLAKETERTPDGWVIYHVAVSTSMIVDYSKVTVICHYTPVLPEGLGAGPQETPAMRFEKGALVFDIINGASGQLVWRGVAYGAVDSDLEEDANRQKILEALQKIFQKFPK